MISWMQKHNKFLIWTIWIATIAFIASGPIFSGSGYGNSRTGSVAQVGSIDIKQDRLNREYQNIYNQYNQMFQGKLDEKKAREMGLVKQAFSNLEKQAKILNLAKDFGIVASDDEVRSKIYEIKAFQKDGNYSQDIYHNYLKSQRFKAKDFEAILRNDVILQKTLALLETKGLPFEAEIVAASTNIADKFAYKVLSTADINYTSDEKKVKTFWENQKENYMTKKAYALSLLWTASENTKVTEEEIKQYYQENSFNYMDAQGKQLDFNQSKEKVSKDLKLKNTKKTAQKAYIAFKKGEVKSNEDITLKMGDLKLSREIWKTLSSKSIGDIIKPKIIGTQYVTIKINKIIEPKEKTFEEAKEEVTRIYDAQNKKEALLALADKTLKEINDLNATVSDFITLKKYDNLKSLNSQESLQFLQKLFTSHKEKGIITVLEKVVVYNILEQKILPVDDNQTKNVTENVTTMKKRMFESKLIEMLDSKYPTTTYTEGLVN